MTGRAAGAGTAESPVIEAPLSRERVAALAEAAPESAGVRLSLPGVVGLLTVRGDPARAPLGSVFERVLGLSLPERLAFTRSDADPGRRARWLSPDEWLVSCALEDVATLDGELAEALAGAPTASVTDVSGGACVFALEGPAVREVLARCVPIDLDRRAFAPGRVASTVFAKATATLACLDDERIEIVCRRSFADYVLRYVANAARGPGLALVDGV